ncbi:hypothetical protein [Candidatus Foliamicus sp.]
MNRWLRSATIATALALVFALGFTTSGIRANDADLPWVAGEFPEQFVRSMEESSAAFLRKDLEATRSHMTEDFATYELHHEDGPRLLVQGREESIAAMQGFFESGFGSLWQGADVDRVGSIGDTMIQIERDHYQFDDGPRTISTLVLIQYRNGKRWREWRLRLADGGG